jgi:UbiD family decarboxylase
VQERILATGDVDLKALPQLVYHIDDSLNPYITGAIVVARDPETGKSNLSFHRLMIRNQNTTTIFIASGKHLGQIYQKYEIQGQSMPIAAFLGVHPTCSLGALFTGSQDIEEYDIIGGLRQSPLPLARCVTNDLSVPAEAEIAIEGFVQPHKRAEEGPFGEFTGYSTGCGVCPVLKVEAITSRHDPLYQDIVSGCAEHLLLPTLGMEHNLLRVAREVAPTTVNVRVALPLTAFVALRKVNDSQPRTIMDALFAADIYIKQVIVVDADVDIFDLRQVVSAVSLHVRPDRDIFIKPQTLGTELDPACDSSDGFTSKFGIDATIPHSSPRRIKKNRFPQHLLDSINLSEFL